LPTHTHELPVGKSPSLHGERPYHFVGRTVFRNVNPARISHELSSRFTIIKPFTSKKTNPLYVLFEVERAVIYEKDVELRSIAFKLYGMQFPFFAREPSIAYECPSAPGSTITLIASLAGSVFLDEVPI